MARKGKTKGNGLVKFHAKLGQFGAGAKIASIGFSAEWDTRERLIELLDLLVNARLDVKLEEDKTRGEQQEMYSDDVLELRDVADCHKLSVGRETVSGRLSFSMEEADTDTLIRFRQRNVKVSCRRTGAAVSEPDATEGASESEDTETPRLVEAG